ncbi:S-layer homology domain-containing protein [Alkaliphilus peptidifermentans]|uniref:S-layer homology domain-containing protein n=1 Tax=Alkaliphilus peptidifermentans DSM 18978 TaxID=1120976 RepID=A0A1G5AJD2_9FIRM|nr:S-layer homology domain-containing protein [Alkaliphilus peptidifermentans]SCX77965.1 S-layer homology domain-containing protein [Alkaliphilus peptidifermentans DSM 18978]
MTKILKGNFKYLIIALLVIYSITSVYANGTPNVEAAGNYLRELGVFKGYEDGSLGLDRNITRAEYATLVVRMMGLEERAKNRMGTTLFTDVAGSFWGSGYINVASEEKLIAGYGNKTFKPGANITFAESVTILVRLLGYESQITDPWPQGHLQKAQELGITSGLDYKSDHIVTRGDIAIMIMQSLKVELGQ